MRVVLHDKKRDERRQSTQTRLLALESADKAKQEQDTVIRRHSADIAQWNAKFGLLVEAQVGNSLLDATTEEFLRRVNVRRARRCQTPLTSPSYWSALSGDVWKAYHKSPADRDDVDRDLLAVSDAFDAQWGSQRGDGVFVEMMDRIRQYVRETRDRRDSDPSLTPADLISYLNLPSITPRNSTTSALAHQFFVSLTYTDDEGKERKVFGSE
ncbi:alkaline proteinase [Pseudohyphozyma bogoriensis]|nr:alkaline proteinase [Pseudohyphozyma bogoriensis]